MAGKGKLGERSEATRARLLAAARELFGERGFAATSIEDIVRAAGVTRGALYHHFSAKEELFAEVFEDVEREFALRSAEAAQHAASPIEALQLGAEAYFDACLQPDIQRISLLDAPFVMGWAAWRDVCAKYNLALLERGLQAAMDAGQIRPGEAEALAHLMHGAFVQAGMAVARAEDPERERVRMAAEARRMLEGLRR